MAAKVEAVMFDLGGTLIDLTPTKDVVFHKVLASHGFKVDLKKVTEAMMAAERRFDEDSTNLDGVHEDQFWDKFDKYILDKLGYKKDPKEFAKAVSREFDKIVPIVECWAEYPDARPLLERMKKKGFTLGVISNATDLARRVMDNLDLTKFFDVIVISAEAGVRKPDERIFLLAAKKAKVAPNKTLYVGDKLVVDILGAKNAGMNAILIDRAGIYSDVDCPRIRSLDGLEKHI